MRSSRARLIAAVLSGGAALAVLNVGGDEASGKQRFPWRVPLADVAWLRLNLAWEKRDEATVRRLMKWTLTLAPEVRFFRVNSARIVAYDIPAWRRQADPQAPAAMRQRWRNAGADEAATLLLSSEPDDPALWLEAANIALYAAEDRELAAYRYRRAAELPGAPWHAGRIHAQLLRDLGREREALEWLRRWGPGLPAGDPAAQRELVLERIAELERSTAAGGEPL